MEKDGFPKRNQKAALSVESISSGAVRPSQAFSWEISGLVEAVAVLDSRVIRHSSTARNDGFGIGKYTGKTFTEK